MRPRHSPQFAGRINRARFVFVVMISQFLVWGHGTLVLFGVYRMGHWLPQAIAENLYLGLIVLLLLASYLVCVDPIFRRAHDLGWSAIPSLISFAVTGLSVATGLALTLFNINASDLIVATLRVVSAPGLFAFVLLLVLPGQLTENRFGPAQKPM